MKKHFALIIFFAFNASAVEKAKVKEERPSIQEMLRICNEMIKEKAEKKKLAEEKKLEKERQKTEVIGVTENSDVLYSEKVKLIKKPTIAHSSQGTRTFVISKAGDKRPAPRLNNGRVSIKDYDSGLWPCVFTIQLSRVHELKRIRICLWPGNQSFYRYKVYVTEDDKIWKILADRSKTECTDWQDFTFNSTKVKAIKIQALHNSSGSDFKIIEIQAFRAKE